ncbi:MAG: hypothetical protein J6K91_09130 [Opitutales bacterium]|nr:hypothetical protein [Opitutales bacterium]
MSKNAQDSQQKTDNLCKQNISEANCDAIADGARHIKSFGKHAYAYKLNRINPDYAKFEIWAYCVGHLSEVISIAKVDEYLQQIERAFFYGEFCITIRGITVGVPEKLLKQIRKDFENLVSHRVGSDEQVGSGDVSTSSKSQSSASVLPRKRQISKEKSGGCRSLSDKPTHLSATATNRISTRNGRTSVIVSHKTLTSNKGNQ